MTCRGPSCSRPVYALSLCVAHYRQQKRGRTLTPITSPRGLVRVSLRVLPATREHVVADPPGARDALDRWSKEKP